MSEHGWNVRIITAGATLPVADEMAVSGCDPRGIERMVPKAAGVAVALEGVDAHFAQILKQEMLAVGGDASLSRDAWLGQADRTDMVLACTELQMEALLLGLAEAPLDLPAVGEALGDALSRYQQDAFTVPLPDGGTLDLGHRPAVMGILNVTPDSFSDGGQFADASAAIDHARRMADEGADILDVGGESTRPGSGPVDADDELRRVMPVIEALADDAGVPVSIDTRKARVAREAVGAGARIINDVSALGGDPEMAAVAADTGAAVVLMHMQGEPKTMQQAPRYANLMADICRDLRDAVGTARATGVAEERLIIDPGIGFGKALAHNLRLLARLGELRSLGRPILVGPSRKRFIGDVTGVASAAARGPGTLAACALAVASGAAMVRVHDVAAARQAVDLAAAVREADRGGP